VLCVVLNSLRNASGLALTHVGMQVPVWTVPPKYGRGRKNASCAMLALSSPLEVHPNCFFEVRDED
jgi:hypothetical protein